MSSPFDDQGGAFVVLVNHLGQHSLWPASVAVPAGWAIAQQLNLRHECIDYINKNWTDMRPGTGGGNRPA